MINESVSLRQNKGLQVTLLRSGHEPCRYRSNVLFGITQLTIYPLHGLASNRSFLACGAIAPIFSRDTQPFGN